MESRHPKVHQRRTLTSELADAGHGDGVYKPRFYQQGQS